MGLTRELIDEAIPLPNAMRTTLNGDRQMCSIYNFSYAFLNAIFQVIDCIIIPYYTWQLYNSGLNFLKGSLCIVGLLASIFSVSQVIFYFLKPADNYVSFLDRIIGETAVGVLLSAIFKIEIKTQHL